MLQLPLLNMTPTVTKRTSVPAPHRKITKMTEERKSRDSVCRIGLITLYLFTMYIINLSRLEYSMTKSYSKPNGSCSSFDFEDYSRYFRQLPNDEKLKIRQVIVKLTPLNMAYKNSSGADCFQVPAID